MPSLLPRSELELLSDPTALAEIKKPDTARFSKGLPLAGSSADEACRRSPDRRALRSFRDVTACSTVAEMNSLRTIVVILISSVLLPAAPSRAATHRVEVGDFFFSPKRTEAVAGDAIMFEFVSGVHDVTAYAGASFRSELQGGGTFEVTYEGGTVLYRCTPHSTLSGEPPACTGMCGVISNEIVEGIPAPAIALPSPGTVTPQTPTISGTAAPGEVEVREGAYSLGRAEVNSGSWWLTIALAGGKHTVHAVVITDDDESPPSDPVTFTVDAQLPLVAIEAPTDLSVAARSVDVAGVATDDRGVSGVFVTARNRVTGAVIRAAATCTGCPTASATWRAHLDLPVGLHVLQATAADMPGNIGTSAPISVLAA